METGGGVGEVVCDGDGLAVGDEPGARDGVGLVVDVELGEGDGGGTDESLVVVIVYKPESPQTFKELLAYSLKPTTTPAVLFKVNVTLPQHGVEEKAAQDALTHCPVLFVLKMYPPPDKLWSSLHKKRRSQFFPKQFEDSR